MREKLNKKLLTFFNNFPSDLNLIEKDLLSFLELLNKYLQLNGKNENIDTRKIKNSYIDETAYIGDFTLIRNSYIGKNCKIGSHVEINNSIILDNNVIPHHNYIGYSLFGKNIRLGGNVRTTVRRLDDKRLRIQYQNEYFEINNSKFGAIIGDNCKIGSTVLFNPFTVIGNDCVIEPGLIISGFFEKKTILKNDKILKNE